MPTRALFLLFARTPMNNNNFQALTYGRGPPGPVVNSVLRTPDGVVNLRPNAMSRPHKATGLQKSPVR